MKTGILLGMLMAATLCHAGPVGWVGGHVGALGGNDETETGFIGGGQAGVEGKHLGVSFHALHYNADNKVQTMSKGSLSLTPLLVNAYGRIPLNASVNLRVGGGFGYVIARHEVDSELTALLSGLGFSIKEDLKSGLGYQAMGGVDFKISRNVSVGADLFYLFFKPDLEASLTRNASGASVSFKDGVKLDTVIGMANIKVYFGGDSK